MEVYEFGFNLWQIHLKLIIVNGFGENWEPSSWSIYHPHIFCYLTPSLASN